jgi:Zn-dependent M28 family amino/carboxypeptidase
VQALTASGDIGRVLHMINLDMIGHAIDDSLSARVESTTAHQSWLDKYAVLAITYAPELNLILSTETRAYSDHWPFLQAGVPAVFTWENGAAIYPHWHQVTDVPANMLRARELAAGILRMDAAMLAGLGDVAGVFASGFEVAH